MVVGVEQFIERLGHGRFDNVDAGLVLSPPIAGDVLVFVRKILAGRLNPFEALDGIAGGFWRVDRQWRGIGNSY